MASLLLPLLDLRALALCLQTFRFTFQATTCQPLAVQHSLLNLFCLLLLYALFYASSILQAVSGLLQMPEVSSLQELRERAT